MTTPGWIATRKIARQAPDLVQASPSAWHGVMASRIGITILLLLAAMTFTLPAYAADKSQVSTSDWPHRTAADKNTIVTLIDTHETVLLLDLLRQGKRQKVEDVLFAMLDLRLMDINDPNRIKYGPFSPGEKQEVCNQLVPLSKLESAEMFQAYRHRAPTQAKSILSGISTLRKHCANDWRSQ